jgi:very-short-patch-repair endonuclease
MMLKLSHYKNPTVEADSLRKALEERGVKVYIELDDGFKTIDLALPDAKINIEVDGIQHLTDPQQILADLGRGYYSHKNGYDTMHIQNEILRKHLNEIADALAEASKIREHKIHVLVG